MEGLNGISSRAISSYRGRIGVGITVPLSKLHVSTEGIGTTQLDEHGSLLSNPALAQAGFQQLSPGIIWQGNGWKTTAVAGSQDVRFRADMLPVQGSTNPTGQWQLAVSINGAAYANVLTITNSGVGAFLSSLSAGGSMTATQWINASTGATQRYMQGSGTAIPYRTTNAGSDLTPQWAVAPDGLSVAGKFGWMLDGTNSAGLIFTAANGTRQIARAAINLVNLTNTAGSETGDLAFLTQTAGAAIAEQFRVKGTGGMTIPSTITTVGTTGNQTINKQTGTVNIAAAGTTVTVTNSLVTTSSIVYCVIRTNDGTATIKNVVPGSGSFVITLNAAATAEISIGFIVFN